MIVRTRARTTITPASGPDPRTIGMGPIKITVPTLPTLPPLNMGASDINRIPTKMIAKAKRKRPAGGTGARRTVEET